MLVRFRLSRAWRLLLLSLCFYVAAKIVLLMNGAHGLEGIQIGSKNFTESIILGELYAQALEKSGIPVERKFNLGGTLIAHEALKRGEIDVYPEYTGTGLIDILNRAAPKNPESAYQILNREYSRRWGLIWLKPAMANDSQALVLTRQTAQKYRLTTLSDLAHVSSRLILAAIPEFEEREDGLRGLKAHYGGFKFKKIDLYDNGLKYQVLIHGNADVAVGFSTDGALRDGRFVILQDDQSFWPAYQVAPVSRIEALKRYPRAELIFNRVSASLDTKLLQELNAKVDLDRQDYRRVARNFLIDRGIL